MTTIKSYSDLQQSKKLASILPLESADGFWEYHNMRYSEGDEWEGYKDYPRTEPYLTYTRKENEWKEDKSDVPCWSLAALLDVLPNNENISTNLSKGGYRISTLEYTNSWFVDYEDETNGLNNCVTSADNPVDACVAMIEKLNEENLL